MGLKDRSNQSDLKLLLVRRRDDGVLTHTWVPSLSPTSCGYIRRQRQEKILALDIKMSEACFPNGLRLKEMRKINLDLGMLSRGGGGTNSDMPSSRYRYEDSISQWTQVQGVSVTAEVAGAWGEDMEPDDCCDCGEFTPQSQLSCTRGQH